MNEIFIHASSPWCMSKCDSFNACVPLQARISLGVQLSKLRKKGIDTDTMTAEELAKSLLQAKAEADAQKEAVRLHKREVSLQVGPMKWSSLAQMLGRYDRFEDTVLKWSPLRHWSAIANALCFAYRLALISCVKVLIFAKVAAALGVLQPSSAGLSEATFCCMSLQSSPDQVMPLS